jgi:hypothetical protein
MVATIVSGAVMNGGYASTSLGRIEDKLTRRTSCVRQRDTDGGGVDGEKRVIECIVT